MVKRPYMVIRTRGPSWDDARSLEQQVGWPAHATFMEGLADDGFLVLVGPLEGTTDVLLIVRASDVPEIEARLDRDPWSKSRLLLLKQIAPWQIRLGSLSVDSRPGTDRPEDEVLRVTHDWDRAMVANDVHAIARYMADDWTIIGPDGRVGDKAAFLALVRSGALSHDVMESHEPVVRVYGDAAVVISRGISGGQYQQNRFLDVERVSCVFVRDAGEWRCVLTHLSRLSG